MGLRSTYRRCRFWHKKKIIFLDEARFDLSGHVKKQNFRISGIENPHAYIDKKVKETDISYLVYLIDKPKREKPKTVCTPEKIAAVAESVCEAPSTSIHRGSQQLNILETSLRRILHKDLGVTPDRVQLVQELKPTDYSMRFRFAKWTCD